MPADTTEPLLNRKAAARYLSVSPGTLAVWDCTKRYDLKPLKIGRAVRYRRADLDKFIEQRLWSPDTDSLPDHRPTTRR